jgi:hypothetical protein
MIRIADSISSLVDTIKRICRHGKNGGRPDTELSPGVAALHLTCLGCLSHRKANPLFCKDLLA